MSVKDDIEQLLHAAFNVGTLKVIDESEQHRGHAGYQEGGESHFRVILISNDFTNLTRIKRHRAVHDALGKDMLNKIHALALELSD